MIDLLGGAPATTEATRSQFSGNSVMGKDEFLQLLVAQLKNQDPLNPSNPEDMAAQLAQFSSVEQLINISEHLEGQASSSEAMAFSLNNSAALNVIGKNVLAAGDTLDVTGAPGDTVTVGVGAGGGNATVTVYDGNGNEVGFLDLGPIGGGRQDIDVSQVTGKLSPGRYRYAVRVATPTGDDVDVQGLTRVLVDGVRYGPKGPVLLAGTTEIPLSDVVEVIS